MCGIAGIFSQDYTQVPSEISLKKMIVTLKHRGPDAQEVWVNKGIGLAHARLSIIDLSTAANQPMVDSDTGNVIVFNGEIYNYIELKEKLLSFGYRFNTRSDTEVILKAYEHWGVDCLNYFNGMWAFALYDNKQRVLFCARDRVGIKPFIYGINANHTLVFASEAKAIIREFPEFSEINESFLLNFVERDFFACYKETFFKKLFNLLPGHYFIAESGKELKQLRYWKWKPCIDSSLDEKNIKHKFKSLLTDAVKLRFRSDVPVGSCLSGGLDSGTIVGIASGLFDTRMRTFSCIYPNSPKFDESFYIKESSKKFNTIAKFIEPTHTDFISLIYYSIEEQDGPTGGPSVLSQRAVMELASKDVKVLLDGQGADELLGGYHGYYYYSLLSILRELKEKKNFWTLHKYWSSANRIKRRLGNKISSFEKLLAATGSPVKFMAHNWDQTQLAYFEEFSNDDLNTLLLEHVFTNLCNLLHYEDRNSMRFSVESRLPFLDYRLVEFAFCLPSKYKIRGATTKWLLSDLAKDILPRSVVERKDKMGFSTPAQEWFCQGKNLNYFRRYLDSSNPLYENLSESTRLRLANSFNGLTSMQNFANTAIDMNGLWRFFTANMWIEARP